MKETQNVRHTSSGNPHTNIKIDSSLHFKNKISKAYSPCPYNVSQADAMLRVSALPIPLGSSLLKLTAMNRDGEVYSPPLA